jgi:uncharacterized membrane protein YcaP (DUF421 family)
MKEIFEWERLLFNDLPHNFFLEVLFRSTVMFLALLITLKFTGKRGVKQLSVFETVIIIALGSAAGDPMFYEDVGIIPALVVFACILLLYRLITWLTAKNKKIEEFLEGKTICFIEDGEFSIENFKKESLAQDEFFTELRIKSIAHLGQVKAAYIETTGEISVYYFPDEEVQYGLPIVPNLFINKSQIIPTKDIYSCTNCGFTEEKNKEKDICKICKKDEWVKSINTTRIT